MTESENSTIVLRIDICGCPGYATKCSTVRNHIIKPMKELGYEVQYDFVSIPGNKNEYFVFMIKRDGTIRPVFSNMKENEKDGAVFDYGISGDNSKKIIDLIRRLNDTH
jgi:hypothetical protein